MKQWNIKDKKENKIFNLLCQYSESLSEITKKNLMADIIVKIENNKFHYLFNVRNKSESFRANIFDIMLLDLNGSLSLIVTYLDDNKSFNITENQLEGVIDDIITSERMSIYINRLLEIDSKHEDKK